MKNLLGASLRAQVVISVRDDWTYVVHDGAEIATAEEAARIAAIIAKAAVDVAHKHGVQLPSLEQAIALWG